MMRYLLDTTAVIAALNPSADIFANRLRQHHPKEVGLSAIVAYELFFWGL